MRVLIADDHAILRRGLLEILKAAFKDAVFGEAETGQQALKSVWKENWDVLVLDVTMPGRSGLEVLKDIKLARPQLPVLVLSMHPEEQYALRVIKAGAAGYLTKFRAPHELVGAVRQVLRLIGACKTVKEIAGELSLSVQTVSTHRAHVLTKLGLHSTAELIRYAVKNDLAD